MCDGTCASNPVALQMRSEAIDKIIPALIQFQSEVRAVGKNKKNPHFGSSYADLAAIMDEAMPALGKNGLAIVQNLVESSPDEVRLLTTLYHTSGQYFSSIITLKPSKTDPQGVGSAITYARRYSLSPLLGIVTEEDDDGNAASGGRPASNGAGGSRGPREETAPSPAPAPARAPGKPGKSEITLKKERAWKRLLEFVGDPETAKKVLQSRTQKPSKDWTEDDLVQIEGFVQDIIDGTVQVDDILGGEGL